MNICTFLLYMVKKLFESKPVRVFATATTSVIIALIFFFATPTFAATSTFGTTTVGNFTDTGDGNSITCNQYTSNKTGTATSLSVAIGTIDTTKKAFSLALYADANNIPTNILGYQLGTLSANSWNKVSVSIPVISGKKYWICYNSNTTSSALNNMKYKSGTVPAIYKAQSYGNWPANFGTVNAKWTSAYSLYATVTDSINPTPTQTPTVVPTALPTSLPTPTVTPTLIPTAIPTVIPTSVPTPIPTQTPTPPTIPTTFPTSIPTQTPTVVPTALPTSLPTPTVTPTLIPTPIPTATPTSIPTPVPTITPTPTTQQVVISTFGTTTVGSTTDTGDGNSITCNQYTANATGIVTSLSAYVSSIDANNKNYSLAMYADANNNPSTYLGSATGTLTANSWNSVNVSIPVAINLKYWLCYNTNTNNVNYNNLKYSSGSVPALYKSQSYGSWPTLFGTVGGKWTDAYSINATITQNGGTTPTPSPVPTLSPTVALTPTPSPTPITSTGSIVISRNLPAFASSGTASLANDNNYNTTWRSSGSTASLTFDLSTVPVDKRQNVLLVWYNEATDAYDPAMAQESAIEYPKDYTIQTNTAPTAGSAPTTGWVTQKTITANKYHSRQHIIAMNGANWIRLNVTSVNGGNNANLNMDIYPADTGSADSWIIYGSSTPSMSLNHNNIGTLTKSFSQLVNEANPNYYPVQENGSISGINTNDGVQNIDSWLAIFPGKYVAIALGANDASECMNSTTFYNNYVTMINKVTSAGKIPVIPLFNWSKQSSVQNCGPALIDKINLLYTNFPQIIKGPDFWNYYKSHPELISSDNTHPTTEGLAIYRQMWAQSAIANVYNK